MHDTGTRHPPSDQATRAGLDLQAVRGLACVLLVLYHVVGSQPTNGLRIADGPLRWLNDALSLIRMPLFAFIAGYAHGLRGGPVDLAALLRGKAVRLLLPTLVVGTLFALLQSWTPGTNAAIRNWSMLHIEPVAHYWFPMALFWIFVAVGALQSARLLVQPWTWTLCLLVAVVAHLGLKGPHQLALGGALYLLPYFLLGLHAQAGRWLSATPASTVAWATALLAAPALLAMPAPSPNMERLTLPVMWAGLCFSALLAKTCPQLRVLRWLGDHAYAIFLFHVFFTAATRQFWHATGIDSMVLGATLGLLAGLLGPVALQRGIDRVPWCRPYLLGSRAAPMTHRPAA